jgi:hypothetical protein
MRKEASKGERQNEAVQIKQAGKAKTGGEKSSKRA